MKQKEQPEHLICSRCAGLIDAEAERYVVDHFTAKGDCDVCGGKDIARLVWLNYKDPRGLIKAQLRKAKERIDELAPLVDEFAKLTELRRNLINLHLKAEEHLTEVIARRVDNGDIFELIKTMSPEEKAALKERLES